MKTNLSSCCNAPVTNYIAPDITSALNYCSKCRLMCDLAYPVGYYCKHNKSQYNLCEECGIKIIGEGNATVSVEPVASPEVKGNDNIKVGGEPDREWLNNSVVGADKFFRTSPEDVEKWYEDFKLGGKFFDYEGEVRKDATHEIIPYIENLLSTKEKDHISQQAKLVEKISELSQITWRDYRDRFEITYAPVDEVVGYERACLDILELINKNTK